jgi:hypothetical protein
VTLPAITWLPSPFKNLRDARYSIRGVVNHRIVGTLPSARAAFGVAPGTSRNASSHFGIGYVNGKLTVDQYVDLADMAWTNGDVREPTWSRIIPGVNPNLYTVTIEHEDGGAVNRGKVSEEVWQASMELQKLLVSGDKDAIRAAGIRVRHDHIVAQLATVPKDATGFIDHHQIAGPNKPYCFRRWLDDPGFVEGNPSRRDRLLAHLNGEDEMPTFTRPVRQKWAIPAGTEFYTGGPELGQRKFFTANVELWSNGETVDGNWRRFEYGDEELWLRRAGLTPLHGTRNPATGFGAPTLGSGYTQDDLDRAAKAGFVDAKTKARVAVEGIGQ